MQILSKTKATDVDQHVQQHIGVQPRTHDQPLAAPEIDAGGALMFVTIIGMILAVMTSRRKPKLAI